MEENKSKILFATPVLRYPAISGPHLRIENSIKALSKISDLYIFCRASLNEQEKEAVLSFYGQFCKGFHFASYTQPNKFMVFFKRVVNYITRRIFNRSIYKGVGKNIEDYGFLLKVANDSRADVIWLGYGNISYPLLKYIKKHSNYPVVSDTDSVWSRFILRGLLCIQNSEERRKIVKAGRKKEEEERWGTKLADVTTAVSYVDAEYYKMLTKHPYKIHIFSNVIDPKNYHCVDVVVKNVKKPNIYLAGTFWPQSPMEDATRWVIEEIYPLVRQQIPNIHFYIIGKDSDKILSDIKDDNISVTGEVPNVLPYLCHADVVIVPLRFESGTRFKILEAGACERAVVSTTLGAEGLSVTDGKDILIADEADSFTNLIVRVINNIGLAKKLGRNLKKLVYQKYSLEPLSEEGRKILDYLLG